MYWTIVPIVGYSIFIEWLCRSVSLHLFAHQKCSPYLSCIYCSGSIHACTQQTMKPMKAQQKWTVFFWLDSNERQGLWNLCCHCEPNVSLSTFLGTFVQLASKFYRLRDLTKSWLFSQPVLLVYINNILSYNFTDYGQKSLWYSKFSYIPRFISFQRQLYIWLQKLLEYTIHEKHEPLYIKLRVQCDD